MQRTLIVALTLFLSSNYAFAKQLPVECVLPCSVGDCTIDVTADDCDIATRICEDNLGGTPQGSMACYRPKAVCSAYTSSCYPCPQITSPTCCSNGPKIDPQFLRIKIDCKDQFGDSLPYGCGLTCGQAKQDCKNRGGIPNGSCATKFGPCPVSTPVVCCPTTVKKRCRLFGRIFGRRR